MKQFWDGLQAKAGNITLCFPVTLGLAVCTAG